MNLPDKSTILIIAPHPDDEILGLGGAIKKFSDSGHDVAILLVSGHLPPLYKEEVFLEHKEQALKAHEIVGAKESIFLEIPATLVKDETVAELNGKIYSVLKDIGPNIVFIPFPDRHIDHRVIFDSSVVVCRPLNTDSPKNVLLYETLSETHWNVPNVEPSFQPNFFVNIDKTIKNKIDALKIYKSQINENSPSRSIEAVKSLAQFRGSQNGCKYAEAFQIVRMVI